MNCQTVPAQKPAHVESDFVPQKDTCTAPPASVLGSAARLEGGTGTAAERFIRHRGNADVVRQDLVAEKGLAVSRRTLQRAVQVGRPGARLQASGRAAKQRERLTLQYLALGRCAAMPQVRPDCLCVSR